MVFHKSILGKLVPPHASTGCECRPAASQIDAMIYNGVQYEQHELHQQPTTNTLEYPLTSSNPNTDLPLRHHIPISTSPRLQQKTTTLPTTPPIQLPYPLPLPTSFLPRQHLYTPSRLSLQTSREQERLFPHAHAPPRAHQDSDSGKLQWRLRVHESCTRTTAARRCAVQVNLVYDIK